MLELVPGEGCVWSTAQSLLIINAPMSTLSSYIVSSMQSSIVHVSLLLRVCVVFRLAAPRVSRVLEKKRVDGECERVWYESSLELSHMSTLLFCSAGFSSSSVPVPHA
jgi:hypothetical protein